MYMHLFQSMTRMIENPPHTFKEEMTSHLKKNAARLVCLRALLVKVIWDKRNMPIEQKLKTNIL